jgi:hypothetical protein
VRNRRLRWVALGIFVATIVIALGVGLARRFAFRPAPRNLVLISIDTLRADRAGLRTLLRQLRL